MRRSGGGARDQLEASPPLCRREHFPFTTSVSSLESGKGERSLHVSRQDSFSLKLCYKRGNNLGNVRSALEKCVNHYLNLSKMGMGTVRALPCAKNKTGDASDFIVSYYILHEHLLFSCNESHLRRLHDFGRRKQARQPTCIPRVHKKRAGAFSRI